MPIISWNCYILVWQRAMIDYPQIAWPHWLVTDTHCRRSCLVMGMCSVSYSLRIAPEVSVSFLPRQGGIILSCEVNSQTCSCRNLPPSFWELNVLFHFYPYFYHYFSCQILPYDNNQRSQQKSEEQTDDAPKRMGGKLSKSLYPLNSTLRKWATQYRV